MFFPKHQIEKGNYSTWQNIRFMISAAKNRRNGLLWICPAIAKTGILMSLLQLLGIPVILDMLEKQEPAPKLMTTILIYAAAMVAASAARAWLDSCAQFPRTEVRLSIAERIQNKMLTMAYPNVEDQDVRRKMDRAVMRVNSINAATERIWMSLIDLLKDAVVFGVSLLLLAAWNPILFLVSFAASAFSFLIRYCLDGWEYRHRDEKAEYSRRLNYLSERSRDYTLAKDIRLFGMRAWMEEIYDAVLRLNRSFSLREERMSFLGDIADVVLTFLKNGVIYLYLLTAAGTGELTAAQFMLYFNAAGTFSEGMGGLLNGVAALHKQSLDISTVREFLDCRDAFPLEEGIPIFVEENTASEIRLQRVSFRYPGAGSDTLKKIDLTIHAGERLAVVGLNGAGKTTLVKLICGFLDPTEGEILLNGVNIKKFRRKDYYSLFSAVFQDFSLLDVTIAENVAQTELGIDRERVKKCLSMAGLEQKITQLPKGIDTHLGQVYEDGIRLSGGETQRLLLARALYKNAPVIVLDEPTAALDPVAESNIYQRYGELTSGRTSIYISHRLASTRFCDRIILLADQGIAEEGSHESLMKKGGRYAELFEIQSRYYREVGGEDGRH